MANEEQRQDSERSVKPESGLGVKQLCGVQGTDEPSLN